MNMICYERGLLWTGLLWTWSVMNVVCYERGLLWTGLSWASEGFFPGRASRELPKIFFQGGPKVVKFVFYPSKLKKQPFFANNFKIQGGPRPFPAPPFDAHGVCYERGLLWTGLLWTGLLWTWSVSNGLLWTGLSRTDTSRDYFTVAMNSNGDSRQ